MTHISSFATTYKIFIIIRMYYNRYEIIFHDNNNDVLVVVTCEWMDSFCPLSRSLWKVTLVRANQHFSTHSLIYLISQSCLNQSTDGRMSEGSTIFLSWSTKIHSDGIWPSKVMSNWRGNWNKIPPIHFWADWIQWEISYSFFLMWNLCSAI